MSLDLLLIDDLHDLAKKYYASDPGEKKKIDRDANEMMFTFSRVSVIYSDIYQAFKLHYRNEFYEKQKGLTFE